MTVSPSSGGAPPTAQPPLPDGTSSARSPLAATPVRIAARWVLLVALTVFAYWDTVTALGIEMTQHTVVTYVPAAATLCLLAAIGVTLRHDDEPPIYDRDTDFIVATVVLLLSLSFQGLLNRRYLPAYLVTHIDVLSLLMFFFGGCVLLFGLRPALRYRWVWLLSLSLFPLPYRVAVVTLGGTPLAAGTVMLALGVAASAVAVGRTRRSAVLGALASATIGVVLLALVATLAPDARSSAYQWIPAVGCAVLTGVFMYVQRRRGLGSMRPFPHRALRAPTAPRVPKAATLLTVVAAGLHLIGSPAIRVDAGVTVAGLSTAPPLLVPLGWHQIETTGVLPSTQNGAEARRMRQVLEQNHGETRFDAQARPRRIVADTVETALPLTLDVYLPALLYDISNTRVSPETAVTLPHGVTGVLQTLVDDQRLLTYNRLAWRWNNGHSTQQVVLFSVDNHEPEAPFPQFRRRRDTWRVVNGMLTLLIRGNAVTEDLNPRFKDRELLTETAGALIDTQVAAIGGGHG
ncbi:hypothetical protein [Gordonia sp. (in: high G+C Gram-positive bacteria)]|uniref:hypothetical protein n=1 Tax=Gordonia sp. (in: high G+C Gram-positive bacteria) TaxID=84139 RepID=UPI0035280764